MFSFLSLAGDACAGSYWWDIFRFVGGSMFAFLSGSYVVKTIKFFSFNFLMAWIYSVLAMLSVGFTIIFFSSFYLYPDVIVQGLAFVWTMVLVLIGTYRV